VAQSTSELRIALLRRLYRLAWRGVQLRALLLPRRARGVKCLLTSRQRVLLVRHTYGQRSTWYLPGGGAHRHESPLRVAEREMHEELGLSGLHWHEVATRQMRLERMPVHLTCLHAELPDSPQLRPDPVEIADVRWFAQDELPTPLGAEVRPLLGLLTREAERGLP
jgi:8-oxo-dGTP pyrophosphatase MutT (NUDIX family)